MINEERFFYSSFFILHKKLNSIKQKTQNLNVLTFYFLMCIFVNYKKKNHI